MAQSSTPMGPGFFIFFQEDEDTGYNSSGAAEGMVMQRVVGAGDRLREEDEEILLIIMAFMGINS